MRRWGEGRDLRPLRDFISPRTRLSARGASMHAEHARSLLRCAFEVMARAERRAVTPDMIISVLDRPLAE